MQDQWCACKHARGACERHFLFSLLHQRADDEAFTRLLQTSLFLVASPFLVKSMFFSFSSSMTLSIQIFLCLPLLLFPSASPCKAAVGFSLHRFHMSKPQESPFLDLFYHCFISPKLFSCFFSFLTFSLLLLPMTLLSQLISTTNSLLSSSFLRHQHSEPYSNTCTIKA